MMPQLPEKKKRFLRRAFLSLGFSAVLSACTGIVPDGPVSEAELQLALLDRTWLWKAEGPGAGVYFGPEGKGAVSIKGRPRRMQWYTKDGRFCYKSRGNTACWFVYRKGGKFYSRLTKGGAPYPWNPKSATVPGNRVY